MLTVHFMPMPVTAYLHCRRGRSTFRKVRIDIGMKEAIYNALPQCTLEVVDATGHIWSRADAKENRGKIILDYKGPPDSAFDPAAAGRAEKRRELARLAELKATKKDRDKAKQLADRAALADKLRGEAANKILVDEVPENPSKGTFNTRLADLEKKQEDEYRKNQDERTTAPETSGRPETKDNDVVQQVGGERSPDGETIRRPVHVQVPLVGSVDARLVSKEERGAEGGSDGLHSSDDEPNVLDNRHAPRVRLVSPANEDSGRD